MSTHTNTVHLIGNLGKDPQVTTFESGKKKASLTLATNESYKNQKGETVENTTWHNVVLWGALADKVALLKKGQKIEVKGSLSNRSYQDKDGNKRYITEINGMFVAHHETTYNEVPMPTL